MNEKLIYFSLMAKDLTNLSDKNYNTLRSIFKMASLKQTLSPFHRVLALRKKLILCSERLSKGTSKVFIYLSRKD